VLLLDEPSEGVAPQVVAQMTLAVQTLKAEGVGILLCEQNDEFTRQVADRTLWLDNGALHDPSQS
jgi:branched-chain amino acid transport system ATP-binding protein